MPPVRQVIIDQNDLLAFLDFAGFNIDVGEILNSDGKELIAISGFPGDAGTVWNLECLLMLYPQPEDNLDINLLLHREVKAGDMIIISKDGTIRLNDTVQTDQDMELM